MKKKIGLRNSMIRKILSMMIILCVLINEGFMGALTKVYAAEVLPDQVRPGEEFNSGYKVTNCLPTIEFYSYKDDASDFVHKVMDYPTSEGAVQGFSGYAEDFTAPSHSISGRSVTKWIKADEGQKSSPDRSQYYYVVGYYAMWPVTVNYHSATPESSEVSEDLEVSFSKKNSTNNLTLKGSDTFSRVGYELVGWSKDEPTNHVDYEPGGTCAYDVDDAELNFYAVWEQLENVSVNVQYRPNGGTGSAVSRTVTASVSEDDASLSSFTLPATTEFTRDDYEFAGWTDRENDYAPGAQYVFPTDAGSLTFDAVWELIPRITVTSQYRPNRGAGDAISVSETVRLSEAGGDGTINLKETADFTRTGYRLTGWKDQLGNRYDLGAEYTVSESNSSPVFDAVWERIPEAEITATYNPGEGTGDAVSRKNVVALSETDLSGTLTLLDKADFKRSGYTLTGWTDGTKKYSMGGTYAFSVGEDEITKAFSFDAVWTAKKAGKVDIDVKKPVYVGAELTYDTEKNSDGDVTVEFKKKGAKDDDYSKKVPTDPGTYIVRATMEESDEYTADEDTEEFEITYLSAPDAPYTYQEVKNSEGTVTDLKVVASEGYSVGISATGAFGSTVLYSTAKAEGGVHLRREKDKAITEQVKLTEYHVSDKPEITVPKETYYGTDFTVAFSALTPAEKKLTYKRASAPDSAYSDLVPTVPGDYVVRLSAPESGFYNAVNETKEFSIVYLEAPSAKAYLDGEKGNDGWFTSDVEIKAPDGYEISTSLGTGYKDSIKWSDSIRKIYYKRDDGAMTSGVDFDPSAKIDMDAPVAKFESGVGVSNPQGNVKVTLDELTFTIEDKNLDRVTVNGNPYDVEAGKCVIKLDAGSDTAKWTVVATDKAGNSYSFTIELSPKWMSDNKMPAGRVVTLKSNIEYSFESNGNWVVSANGVVDKTVYPGGIKFFVKKNMEYTFTRQYIG